MSTGNIVNINTAVTQTVKLFEHQGIDDRAAAAEIDGSDHRRVQGYTETELLVPRCAACESQVSDAGRCCLSAGLAQGMADGAAASTGFLPNSQPVPVDTGGNRSAADGAA